MDHFGVVENIVKNIMDHTVTPNHCLKMAILSRFDASRLSGGCCTLLLGSVFFRRSTYRFDRLGVVSLVIPLVSSTSVSFAQVPQFSALLDVFGELYSIPRRWCGAQRWRQSDTSLGGRSSVSCYQRKFEASSFSWFYSVVDRDWITFAKVQSSKLTFSELSQMVMAYSQLREFKPNNNKRICIGHINVNSIRKDEDNPLNVLRQDYLDKLKLDILCIQEIPMLI